MYFRYLEHIYTNNQPETKVILKELTRFVKISQLIVVTELFFVCQCSFIKEKFGEKFVLLETDLDAVENMEYYQVQQLCFFKATISFDFLSPS